MHQYLSSQSIEDKLQESQSKSLEQDRNQYLVNLKSECVFKQNALKTAQNLILEYQRENEQLKMDKLMLIHKIQDFQHKSMQFQIQVQQNREKQKQFFKISQKLTEIYEKYSILQKKYYHVEKQLSKYKLKFEEAKQNYKQKNQIQFQKNYQTKNDYRENVKTGYSKEREQNVNKNKKINAPQFNQWKSNSSPKNNKLIDQLKNDDIRYQKMTKTNKRDRESLIINQNMKKQIKVLQWRIKQKDQEIMLMLRRNKQIQQKYQTLLKMVESKQKTKVSQKDYSYRPKKLTLNELTNDSIDNYSTWKNQYLSSFYS